MVENSISLLVVLSFSENAPVGIVTLDVIDCKTSYGRAPL